MTYYSLKISLLLLVSQTNPPKTPIMAISLGLFPHVFLHRPDSEQTLCLGVELPERVVLCDITMFLNPGKGSSAMLSFYLPEHEHICLLLFRYILQLFRILYL